MVSIFVPSFCQKKIRAKKRQKRQNWTRAKKIFTFFFVKFGISGPKNPWNQLFEPLEGHTQKLKNDPQETWPNPNYRVEILDMDYALIAELVIIHFSQKYAFYL